MYDIFKYKQCCGAEPVYVKNSAPTLSPSFLGALVAF